MSFLLLSKIKGFFSAPDIALDLGTANTRLYAAGCGLLADQPTQVKIEYQNRQITHRSQKPRELDGIDVQPDFVTPLERGVVKNVPAAALLLKCLLQRNCDFKFNLSRVIVCSPSDVTVQERTALLEAVRQSGIANVKIVPEPLAAAIGAGLDVASSYAQMLVDLGDGVTDIAVIRAGKLIRTAATRDAAGSSLHNAVREMVKKRYRANLLKNQAEPLTRQLGAVLCKPPSSSTAAQGTDQYGKEISVLVSSEDVCEAIKPIIATIAQTVRKAIKEMPAEVSAEVIESSLCLTGGVAELPGIADYISSETNLEVKLAPQPLYSVINGASRMLDTARATNLWLN